MKVMVTIFTCIIKHYILASNRLLFDDGFFPFLMFDTTMQCKFYDRKGRWLRSRKGKWRYKSNLGRIKWRRIPFYNIWAMSVVH